MAKEFSKIDTEIREWISRQRVFFVSTAPLSGGGLINCSPKGMDTFRVLDDHTVAYLDLTGSGVETIAHLKENGRIVIMMCAFAGLPKIFRFHGKGKVLEKGGESFERCIGRFHEYPGARSIIKVAVERISDSCGYSVPEYEFGNERDVLVKWAEKKGDAGVIDYQQGNNCVSLDGLSGLERKKI